PSSPLPVPDGNRTLPWSSSSQSANAPTHVIVPSTTCCPGEVGQTGSVAPLVPVLLAKKSSSRDPVAWWISVLMVKGVLGVHAGWCSGPRASKTACPASLRLTIAEKPQANRGPIVSPFL